MLSTLFSYTFRLRSSPVENLAFVFIEIPGSFVKNQVTLFFVLQLLIVFNKIAAAPRAPRIQTIFFQQHSGSVRATKGIAHHHPQIAGARPRSGV